MRTDNKNIVILPRQSMPKDLREFGVKMLESVGPLMGKLALAVIALLTPVHALMIATGCLIMLDLISGIWRAVKTGEKVTSNGLRRTITKIVAYNLAVITGFILETYFLGGIISASKVIATLIALTEGKSILENLSKITGIDFWSAILKKLQGSKEVDKQ